ncbi:MAG: hypothetical protein ACRDE8_14515, partial [Ginsengibacter sp.]
LPACKKSDKKQTTAEKIQSKWNVETDVINDHISDQDNISTYTGQPGDVVDFRADGKVYSTIAGWSDTSAYTLSGDTKISIEGAATYDITTLTPNSFVLHDKENMGGSNFEEETLSLKK